MIRNKELFVFGLTTAVGGALAMSAADEILVAAVSAGLGLAIAPIQAPVTAVGGAAGVAVGVVMIGLSFLEAME